MHFLHVEKAISVLSLTTDVSLLPFFHIISINIYFPHISWGLDNDFLAHNLFFTFSMYIHFSHTCFYVLK